ncbi:MULTISPECIES: PIN domain-containing protein [unclassified Nodularia (in: cyanobacteria)]|uniref:PIN domain-containing protein n=1 Tax=unclassified Nodularia (in: cyanobacteria) TaxID=2656917 RepID=UPI0018807D63|nr:PIN domain-containing protein [Nodularia sp. LEGE 06071]MBE9200309.1 PIN domain-containing protein [Nodularia sp. LEGE 06071]MCC2694210.1 PIN domain-containing protein [Nodularia sp. LEGE 04288]
MTKKQSIIVDTNILFSALLNNKSSFSTLLLQGEYSYFICELVLVELFKRKEKIIKVNQLSETEIVRIYQILLQRLNLYKEDLIAPDNRATAYALCQDIDESDTPHVALTLELKGLLWTGDKKLKEGLIKKGFKQFFELNDLKF